MLFVNKPVCSVYYFTTLLLVVNKTIQLCNNTTMIFIYLFYFHKTMNNGEVLPIEGKFYR